MPADGAIGPRVGIREIAGSGLLRGISRDRVALTDRAHRQQGPQIQMDGQRQRKGVQTMYSVDVENPIQML